MTPLTILACFVIAAFVIVLITLVLLVTQPDDEPRPEHVWHDSDDEAFARLLDRD